MSYLRAGHAVPTQPVAVPAAASASQASYLARCPGRRAVSSARSRARGAATALSDWDFMVAAAEFEAVRDAVPSLTARDVVTAELGKLHAHPLGPLGGAAVRGSLAQAVAEYRAARE